MPERRADLVAIGEYIGGMDPSAGIRKDSVSRPTQLLFETNVRRMFGDALGRVPPGYLSGQLVPGMREVLAERMSIPPWSWELMLEWESSTDHITQIQRHFDGVLSNDPPVRFEQYDEDVVRIIRSLGTAAASRAYRRMTGQEFQPIPNDCVRAAIGDEAYGQLAVLIRRLDREPGRVQLQELVDLVARVLDRIREDEPMIDEIIRRLNVPLDIRMRQVQHAEERERNRIDVLLAPEKAFEPWMREQVLEELPEDVRERIIGRRASEEEGELYLAKLGEFARAQKKRDTREPVRGGADAPPRGILLESPDRTVRFQRSVNLRDGDTASLFKTVDTMPGSMRFRGSDERDRFILAQNARGRVSPERIRAFFQPFDALVLDIDGTLTDRYEDGVTPLADRLELLVKAGVPTAFVSGRNAKDSQKSLPDPTRVPGAILYARSGAEIRIARDGNWIPFDEPQLPSLAPYVTPEWNQTMRKLREKIDELRLEPLFGSFVKDVKKSESDEMLYALSLSAQTRDMPGDPRPKEKRDPDAPVWTVPLKKSAGAVAIRIEEMLRARLALPPELRVYVGRNAVQLFPEGVTKEACLAHFRATHPSLQEGSRVLSIADQPFPGVVQYGVRMRRGMDAGLLEREGGLSVGSKEESLTHPSALFLGRTGVVGTAVAIDNASFRLPDLAESADAAPATISAIRIQQEARDFIRHTRERLTALLPRKAA